MVSTCPLKAKKWLLLGLITALVVVGTLLIRANGNKEDIVNAAEEVPVRNKGVFTGNLALDFTLEDENGKKVSLSDFFGKPIVLNFWASWCSPCKAEMPYMEKTWREYQEQGSDLVFLLVNVGESLQTVKSFYEKNFYTMPLVYDTKSTVFSRYLLRGIPATFFIDREGVIRGRYNELMPEAKLKAKIAEIVNDNKK